MDPKWPVTWTQIWTHSEDTSNQQPATLRLTGGKRSVSRPLRPCAGRCRIVRHRP
jgi:hypothetical protein